MRNIAMRARPRGRGGDHLAAGSAAQDKVTLSIATGPTTGVYYPLGGGIANILSKYVPGYAANAESTAGSVANLQLMGQKKSDLALSMADAAWDGYKGQGKFAGGAVPMRTLMVAYPNRMHVVTVEGTGINKIADLKGKRVSTGAPNSATELMAARVLEAVGLDQDKDIQRERLDPRQIVRRDQGQEARRLLLGGRHPDLGRHRSRRYAGHQAQADRSCRSGRRMNKKYGPLYIRDTIPAKSYPGQEQPNQVATVQNMIIARADMPDQVAYNIVKTIFDKRDELIQVHKEAQNFDLKFQTNAASPIPFHPGCDQVLCRERHQAQVAPHVTTARQRRHPAVRGRNALHRKAHGRRRSRCRADRHRRAAEQGRAVHRGRGGRPPHVCRRVGRLPLRRCGGDELCTTCMPPTGSSPPRRCATCTSASCCSSSSCCSRSRGSGATDFSWIDVMLRA